MQPGGGFGFRLVKRDVGGRRQGGCEGEAGEEQAARRPPLLQCDPRAGCPWDRPTEAAAEVCFGMC